MKDLLIAIILSILPIAELRGGIPYALATLATTQLTLSNILFLSSLCVIANMLVVLPIFFFLDFFHVHFLKLNWYNHMFNFFIKKIQKKSHELEPQINKYGYLALAIFVGIPLPMTGAWTGAIIAWFLDLNRKKSFVAIGLGVIMAGIIITLASLGVIGFVRL